ncbi:unnamed protein product [Zymoseptoria tritici ST99CH_1A5]|uniref:Uncharacterized protein n=3 Tax=Zymoseptoria tritici TaxID=1047171 RepID=A0A1X7S8I1_ZYMT9|nr:unnamed protein product [Zymoseptoria tritici ST99CH_3D7]SMR61828.1 unnamed protein product [Zymoseptoria tritici ST99CH_1E4]SMR64329.1 unnamed protein product [Zymoseptoria tritici ST99CH_3D1]SMY29673.1 unnamed protein product [Zymoseptoria tritici ST99CH_1A5]
MHCGYYHSNPWAAESDSTSKIAASNLPVVGGHEIFGTIAKVGPDAEGLVSDDIASLDVGAKRIVYHWLGCSNCTDQEKDNLCGAQQRLVTLRHGGLDGNVVVPHPKCLIDPGDLDPTVACTFGCAGVTAISAVSKILPVPADDPVLLIGAGGVELATISALRAYGHRNIISVGIGDDKLAAASKAGATTVINSSQGDPAKAITEACGGPVLSVVDFVNNSEATAIP